MAMKPAGQDPATRPSGLVEPSHTTALLQPKSQSFLDHLIAGFWPTGSSNNPDAAEQSANTAQATAWHVGPIEARDRIVNRSVGVACSQAPTPVAICQGLSVAGETFAVAPSSSTIRDHEVHEG